VLDLPTSIRSRPGDERPFVHKKLLSIGKTALGLVPGGGIVRGAFETGLGLITRRSVPRTLTARPTRFSEAEKQLGRTVKFGGGDGDGGCSPGTVRHPDFGCIARCSPFGKKLGLCPEGGVTPGVSAPIGEAMMGQYGAGLEPGSITISRAVCLRGMQLGNDGLCYNKSQISDKQRMWPAGRKPLLTGGDMGAISTAARAGRRLELATKRLQKMGMMKKPVRGRLSPARGRALVVKEAGPGGVTVQ